MSFLNLFVSRPQGNQHQRRTRPTQKNYRLSMEALEDRTVPAGIVWENRGLASDHFAEAFGAQAAVARGVVDSAIAEWNRVIQGYQGNAIDVELHIAMDPDNPGTYAFAHDTVRDANGVPTSGQITINMGIDEDTGQSVWFLDPTPDNHDEFQGTLTNAFAREPTPGGPAAGKRDLRTLIIHEIGHTMGISGGSPLMYDNLPNVSMVNTNIPDAGTSAVGDTYWLFKGTTVNSLMTNYDILADDYGTAGHNAMPRDGNPKITFGNVSVYSAVDVMQPTSLSVRRVLLSNRVAMMMNDMGYDVTMPELHGTFYAMLDSTGILHVRGGSDDTQINYVNQGVSHDTFVLNRSGNTLFVSVDVGVDVPGTGSGKTVKDQQDAFTSRFNLADVHGIVIDGLGGNDTFAFSGDFGFLPGNIVVHAGEGNDSVNASNLQNHDIIVYGDAGNDTLRGTARGDQLFGGTGNDIIYGNAGNDYLLGDAGNDFLYGNAGDDTIYAGAGVDIVVGGSALVAANQVISDGNDVLAGDEDNDILYGDNVFGGFPTLVTGGNDTIHGGTGQDTLFGGVGNDQLYGDAGNDILGGAAGADTLDGGTENDVLLGGDQNDLLIGGMGADTLRGGEGNDTLIGGTYLVEEQDGSDDLLYGENGQDTLLGDNFALGSSVTGGNDTLEGGAGNDNLYGQFGNDTLRGGSGDDYIRGGDGQDVLYGGIGHDDLGGETGNDTLFGEAGHDQLNGGDGEDNLYGGLGNDTMDGGGDDDLLLGEDGNDTLSGGTGNDMIRGGLGNDDIDGGEGDDLLLGEAGLDVLAGGLGRDLLIGGQGADRLTGSKGEDLLIAGTTSHDRNTAALIAIFSEWRSSKDQGSRVMNLRRQANPLFNNRLNGQYFLRKGIEVFNDAGNNLLNGQQDSDWFFFLKSKDTTDKVAGEVEN